MIVTQIKMGEDPIIPIDGVCYNLDKICKHARSLPCMPHVMYCHFYQQRLKLDWPFPTRLPGCQATEDWFEDVKQTIRYWEI